MVNESELIRWDTAGIRMELCAQFISARNRKPPWSNIALVLTVSEI
jgi:hypothetical protein